MVKNNYSSGRNDDRIAHPNGKNEPQEFADEGADEGVHEKDVMQCHSYSAVGNMNLNRCAVAARPPHPPVHTPCPLSPSLPRLRSMLVENIRSHDYFKGLAELKTFEEVVDQIYYDCKMCCMWMPGTHKTQRAAGMCSGLRGVSNAGVPASSAMLLFKLYTLQLTKEQVKTLIHHPDSVFIKALGFLYLRHVCSPKELWAWCEPHINARDQLSEQGDEVTTTLGRFVQKLLLEQEFHDCMLPRLPVPVAREMEKNIAEKTGNRSGGGGGGGGGAGARGGLPRHEYEVVVCHMNVIRYFTLRALQLPPEAWLRMGGFNGSITHLQVRSDGRVSLVGFGDHGHLSPEETTFGMSQGLEN